MARDLSRARIEAFLEMMSAERGAAANTLLSYQRDLDDLHGFLAGTQVRLDAATPADLRAYIAHLAGQGFKATSQARRLSAMRQFYKFLYAEGLRGDDPTGVLDTPKKARSLPKIMSVEEVTRLLSLAETEAQMPGVDRLARLRMLALLELLYATGMRVSELVSLPARVLDQEGRFLIVRGKGNKERLVYLNDACLDALQRYKKVRTSLPNLVDRDALFVSKRTGKRLSARRIEQIVARCLQSAGLSGRGFSPHKLRHTAATLMYQGGVDMLALKEILGHENVSTTQIYTHINREQLKKAVAASPLATQKYVEQKPSAPDAPDPHDGEYSPDGSESR